MFYRTSLGVEAIIGTPAEKWRRRRARRRRARWEMAQTLAVASQMALLCPSGMDVWMQRELSGCTDLDRFARADHRQGKQVHRER